MSQTIKRGGKSVRRVAAQQGKSRKVRAVKQKTGGAVGSVLAALPFTEAQMQKGLLVAILGGAAVLAWSVAVYAGVPDLARAQFATIAADQGFEVHRVEVRGVKRLNELKVYERVLAQKDRAMPLVDLGAIRAGLMQLSWVADARVSRQLPDTLVVDIVERVPHAVLARGDKYVLIDDQGHELEPVGPEGVKGKFMVSGPGAGAQVGALGALLDAAPALRPQVRSAEWVGNRRWNLTFKTDQVLALPEGDQPAADALVSFARMDGVNRLLGGKVAAFDMRAPDRIYLRMRGKDGDATARPASIAVQPQVAAADPAPKAAQVDKPAPKDDVRPSPSTAAKPGAKPSAKASAKPAAKAVKKDDA
ncbi:cell division protein FtsQ/DivIB [Parablastomonas sp. CN1-191]|uniref:cell division protein FtsQ/DivIB n=1 Tax=Parablastomonas sp. CN1-191 TaxID=3400908 RepID=UPI003BF78A36